MKTDNTLVVGWNADEKEPAFVKSFDYPNESKEMYKCINYVTENFDSYRAGNFKRFDLDADFSSDSTAVG